MGRKRTRPLPKGITERKRAGGRVTYRISFVDQHGELQQETLPRLEDAERQIAKRRAEVAAGTYRVSGVEVPSMTVAELADAWLADQKARGARSYLDMEIIVRLHIKPALGDRRLDELTPPDVAAWIRAMTCAAKSVRNRHGVLHSILQLAHFRGLVASNVATLPRGMLPTIGKKRQPRFTRDELWQLLTDERIAEHRRVFYALQGLGGMRLGEASGRRWRDLDTETPHLACLTVATQYDDKPLKTAKGERTAERVVPVHVALSELLTTWRRRGFRSLFGRDPRPEDWIIPDPKTGKPRTREQARNALARDCDKVGVDARGTHALRRAFISLARSDGARKDVLEIITHNAAGAVIDMYTSLEWQTLCEAVTCLRFELRRAHVVALPVAAAGGGGPVDEPAREGAGAAPFAQPFAQPVGSTGNAGRSGWRCRESNPSPRAVRDLPSTCVVRSLMSLRRPPTDRLPPSPSTLFSRPHSGSRE